MEAWGFGAGVVRVSVGLGWVSERNSLLRSVGIFDGSSFTKTSVEVLLDVFLRFWPRVIRGEPTDREFGPGSPAHRNT